MSPKNDVTSFNIYHTLLHIYFHNCYALEVYEFN
jgi:hypothetical protein